MVLHFCYVIFRNLSEGKKELFLFCSCQVYDKLAMGSHTYACAVEDLSVEVVDLHMISLIIGH